MEEKMWMRCRGCDLWERDLGRATGFCLAGRGQTLENDYHNNCWVPIVKVAPSLADRDALIAIRAKLFA